MSSYHGTATASSSNWEDQKSQASRTHMVACNNESEPPIHVHYGPTGATTRCCTRLRPTGATNSPSAVFRL